MDPAKVEDWLLGTLQNQARLSQAIEGILQNLLRAGGVDFLSIVSRTKSRESALEKIRRKGYKDPAKQLTDLSGVRAIVFLESDVARTSEIVSNAFLVDVENSLNKDVLLSTNQLGYRSVHFVCQIGDARSSLPEFDQLSELKFEIQVRTVLQHAWAELAHDSKYKFAGKLPREIERKLYLYAGMLEIADRGFEEVAGQIDEYAREFSASSRQGNLDREINSITLESFVENWARENNFDLQEPPGKDGFPELIEELRKFGVTSIEMLHALAPMNYAELAAKRKYSTNIYGLVRDWMLIDDWRKFLDKVSFSWVITPFDEEGEMYSAYFNQEELEEFYQAFLDAEDG